MKNKKLFFGGSQNRKLLTIEKLDPQIRMFKLPDNAGSEQVVIDSKLETEVYERRKVVIDIYAISGMKDEDIIPLIEHGIHEGVIIEEKESKSREITSKESKEKKAIRE